MANCLNCRSKLGCACKKRTATDGKSCCVSCLPNYERTLSQKNGTSGSTPLVFPTEPTSITPILLSVTAVQTD